MGKKAQGAESKTVFRREIDLSNRALIIDSRAMEYQMREDIPHHNVIIFLIV
ncbi:MAG: hypothetical protein NTX75_12535 [Proteobacteria bacterium]|nr:hypothetical protein [Pseudomonadota bacterium]